jgi:hypothetical protein
MHQSLTIRSVAHLPLTGGTPAPAPASATVGALTTWGSTAPGGGAATTAASPAENNVPVSGETSFAQLPQSMQQKIFEAHRLIMEHRRHVEGVGRFSTQDYGLEQHTKKLKLDILRVQNAHSELALAAAELRKQVERLRGYIQKLQAAESGLPQYSASSGRGAMGGGSAELWQQQQQDSHAEILREVVGQFEARLAQYDAHIQDLYRKVVSAHGSGGGSGGAGGQGQEQVTPDQLAALIRLQNDALLKVAAQVAGVHEMVERVRSEWTSRAGADPFEELDILAAEEEERKRRAARLVVPSSSSSSSMAMVPAQGMLQLGNAPAAQGGGGLAGAATPGMFGGAQGGLTPQQPTQLGGASAFGAGTQSLSFFGQSDPGTGRSSRQKRSTRR